MSRQSELIETTKAEELAKSQQEISIAEFFEKNKHMLGFDSKSRSIVTAVKEAVDNALDASEEADILPDIDVEIKKTGNYYTVIIEDNGPGIAPSSVKKVFGKLLYGSRFHSNQQTRGQQGIGISAAVLYSQKTSGKPAKITTKTGENQPAQYLELVIDTETNEPEIREQEEVEWDKEHGTRIELQMEANMRGRKQLLEYIQDTAIVNPHATISLTEPKNDFKSERVTDELPPETEEIKPHPHGVELGTLQDMLQATDSYSVSGFLQEDFTRVGQKTAENIIGNFTDFYYGREFAWNVTTILEEHTDEFKDGCKDVISRKSEETTERLVSDIYTDLIEQEYVAHQNVTTIVTEISNTIEDETDERIGETVRENIESFVWSFITENRIESIYTDIRELASKRKDDDLLELIAESIDSQIGDSKRITQVEWEDIVLQASEKASDEHGQSYGETAREKVIDHYWEQSQRIEEDTPAVKEVFESRDMAESLLKGMTEATVMAPPTDCLAPVEPELIEEGLRKEYDAEFYTSTKRSGGVHAGSPFVVEAGLAYGGSLASDKTNLRRFANRVPLVYQPGACSITQVAKDINWRNYGLKQPGGRGLPQAPVVLLVHVASTNVPFTSESKDAIAQVEEIEFEIEQAIRECARDMRKFSDTQQSLQERRKKQNKMGELIPAMTKKFAKVAGRSEPELTQSLARIMNNLCIYNQDNSIKFVNNTDSTTDITVSFDTEIDTEEFTVEDGKTTKDITLKKDERLTIDIESISGAVETEITGVSPEKITHNLSGSVLDSLGEGDGQKKSIKYTVEY